MLPKRLIAWLACLCALLLLAGCADNEALSAELDQLREENEQLKQQLEEYEEEVQRIRSNIGAAVADAQSAVDDIRLENRNRYVLYLLDDVNNAIDSIAAACSDLSD